MDIILPTRGGIMMEKLKRFTSGRQGKATAVRVGAKSIVKLKKMAKREKCSMAEIVRYLIDRAYQDNAPFD